ncbi:MAG: aminotransferase class III-fold pyridoxal phosphate-dependent enzyme, partial [Planctomycetota bacterium]
MSTQGRPSKQQRDERDPIAIVGMAARVPMAADIFRFWQNLKNGVEANTEITAEDLLASGLNPGLLDDPDYVAGTFALEDVDRFDAPFFGLSPREAEIMDPQLRLMLEVAWTALEHAGYDPHRYAGRIGVFGGVGRNSYLHNQILTRADLRESVGEYHMLVLNERDFPTTHISYRLNLRGPSVDVQTACSTSGVAIHLAAQSLRNGDCDMALVGGCKVICPNRAGYQYDEGGPLAPEPRIRAFDAEANGMVRSSGATMLVLKHLSEARKDHDCIYGILRGSAINNDGSGKIGFTAPSVRGQAEVIANALADAGLNADDISYVEAHGTGTKLGDPIEVSGLTKAFRQSTKDKTYCGLGSVKTNIGHIDAGAAAAGVIKTLLAMQHEQIPASLNYTQPNSQIDFANSPFYVNTKLQPWPRENTPRRAGVSSFGLGGTNVHLILEEGPDEKRPESDQGPQLILVSARTTNSLDENTSRLAEHLQTDPQLNLRDIAYTLQVGRHHFSNRRFYVGNQTAELSKRMADLGTRPAPRLDVAEDMPVAFMFPGGGAQYVNMGRGLYESVPAFRAGFDECAELLKSQLDEDIRALVYRDRSDAQASEHLEAPSRALPALFSTEYALARMWMSWGVTPTALIGHSMGEYVAACLAGVMSLADALAMVSCRGRLFETLPEGAMLSVLLEESQVAEFMTDDLSFAAINRPNACVVSGSTTSIEALQQRLSAAEIDSQRVHIRVAAHSALVESILPEFEAMVRGIELSSPQIPFVSNVTGTWIQDEEATDSSYWVRHLRQTVRFSNGISALGESGDIALLEVGPGQTLSTFARQHPATPNRQWVVSSIRHPQEAVPDPEFLLSSLGNLWLAGVNIDWEQLHGEAGAYRIGLPGYAFDRQRHWIDAPLQSDPQSKASKLAPTAEHQSIPAEPVQVETPAAPTVPPANRRERILGELQSIISDLSGMTPEEVDPDSTFLELGFDSLFLAQANGTFKTRFGVRLTARQLLEKTPTLRKLSEYLDEELPADAFSEPAAAAPSAASGSTAKNSNLDAIADQLQRLQAQVSELSGTKTSQSSAPEQTPASAPTRQSGKTEDGPRIAKPDATSPWQPVQAGSAGGSLTQCQQSHLADLIARVEARTPESKKRTQDSRPYLSDPRTVSGFRSAWKELIYPIVSDRASGSRIWDVDGNEYIDLIGGYGVNFFGHCPDFIIKAVEAQLRKTVAIGPQTPLAGEVAELISELTGMERVAFCNTGSEGVLAAIRTARTVTGRKRLACFAGHYHGIFDEVLVKGLNVRGNRRTVPIAPGIPPEFCEDVLVMDYGDPASLDLIREHAHDIALVMLEPVRGREPERRPVEFVRELRKVTEELDIPMLFDEMVTGFRTHPGGMQALWGVRADLATYGKVVGGGFPIGIVTGSAKYMDVLDGGMWQYGDDSQPEADMTWFAGTFVRHPAALAAAKAVLLHLKDKGPDLQESVAARAARFADDLNQHFQATGAPIRVEQFSSWYVVNFSEAKEYSDLLYHHLHNRGVYAYGGRPAFITTEHSDEDMSYVATAFKESVAELQRAGFIPGRPLQREDEILQVALTDGQQEIWLATRFGDQANMAFNLASTLELRGTLRVDLLQDALNQLITRHEALRAVPNTDGQTQRILPAVRVEVPIAYTDLAVKSDEDRASELSRLRADEVSTALDIEEGPLLRAQLIRLDEQDHVFILTAHHIIADGWSCGIIMRELGERYAALCEDRPADLPPIMQLSEWVARCESEQGSDAHAEAIQHFVTELKPPIPILELPTDRTRPLLKTFGATRVDLDLDQAFTSRVKDMAMKEGATVFVALLSAFELYLHRLSGQSDLVIGASVAGQSQVQGRNLVGHCVKFLPIRSRIESPTTFHDHLLDTRGRFLDALEHQNVTFGTLIRELRIKRDPSRVPLISIAFNLDPSYKGITFHDLKTTPSSIPRRYENFDIFFNIVDRGSEFQIQCTFNEDLWDRSTMNSRLQEFATFLSGIIESPTSDHSQLPLLDAQGRAEVLQLLNFEQKPLPDVLGISELFEQRVEASPDALAIQFADRSITYAELNNRCNQLAHHLRDLGVGPEMVVAICLERSEQVIVAMLAVLKAGGAYLPLDPEYPSARLTYMVDDAHASVLITTSDLQAKAAVDDVDSVLLDENQDDIAKKSAQNLEQIATRENQAYVLYTSGSTGDPKGVQVTHENLLNLAVSVASQPGFTAADQLFSVTTFC